MTDQIKEALDYIINNKKIRTVFQSTVSFGMEVYGYEALSRITCESEIKDIYILLLLHVNTTDVLNNADNKFKIN